MLQCNYSRYGVDLPAVFPIDLTPGNGAQSIKSRGVGGAAH
jgi:hypothetical protein